MVLERLDDVRRAQFSMFFYTLQETHNRKVTEMDVENYIVYGRDHGQIAMLCPRRACQLRRSWVGHERCTAILVASELVGGSVDFEGLDSIGWYGLYGPECRGGGEDEVTYEKNTMAAIIEGCKFYNDKQTWRMPHLA